MFRASQDKSKVQEGLEFTGFVGLVHGRFFGAFPNRKGGACRVLRGLEGFRGVCWVCLGLYGL